MSPFSRQHHAIYSICYRRIPKPILCLAQITQNKRLILAGEDRFLRFYDIDNRDMVDRSNEEVHADAITCMALTKDDLMLVTGRSTLFTVCDK